jgi:hypothetical protein
MGSMLRVCLSIGIVLLATLSTALPLSADQPDFAYQLDVQPPENVGDPFVINESVTQLIANANELSTIRVMRPDGQLDYQGDPAGGGASLAGWQHKETFRIKPTRNGDYTIQVVRVYGDISHGLSPDQFNVMAETRVSTDKADPALATITGQYQGVIVTDLETFPDPPLPGQPTQVLVTLSNTNPYPTDVVASLSMTWAGGSGSQPVGQVLFKALQPGEQRTVPFAWTPSQSVDGAELAASVSGSTLTTTWSVAPDASQDVAPQDSAPSSGDGQE